MLKVSYTERVVTLVCEYEPTLLIPIRRAFLFRFQCKILSSRFDLNAMAGEIELVAGFDLAPF